MGHGAKSKKSEIRGQRAEGRKQLAVMLSVISYLLYG